MFWSRVILVCLMMFSSTRIQAEKTSDFAHAIAPILRKHCVECHGGKEAKGGFSINTRKSFLDEEYAVPRDAESSYFLDLILSDDPESQMPPAEKSRLSEAEIATLKDWVNSGMKWEDDFTFATQTYEPPLEPYTVELPPIVDGRSHPIDRIIDQYFSNNKVPRPQPIDDATFYRRASLDLIGLLPTPEKLNKFITDRTPDKRKLLVDELLSQQIDYADHWLSFWNDLLRNDYTGTGFITGGRKQISGWLYESLLSNKPYDQFARELIAPPTDESRGFIDGIKWRGEVSAGQTLEIQFSQSISQAFLGLNMKCASCHDSFIDRWTLKEAYGLAAIYSQRELMIHRCDKPTGETAEAAWLFPALGNVDANASQPERLNQLAALMTHPKNGRFTRTIVNRLWAQLMGRGLIHPLDAMQSEPWHADLLELLSNHLQENNYDLKSVLRLITTSEAYQSQTEIVTQSNADGEYIYRGPRSKRMTAEQFLDGVWQITQSGPNKIDAPVLRSEISQEEADQINLQGKWIWRTPVAPDDGTPAQAPAAGESVLIRKTLNLESDLQFGVAAITCDNEYVLFINNAEVSRNTNWEEVDAIPLHQSLKPGENKIIAFVKNAGASPNAAGFYLEAKLILMDETEITIASDESWEWNEKIPRQTSRRLGKVSGDWNSVHVVPELSVWKDKTQPQVKGILARVRAGELPMIRASLMKSDFLMRSLGRPLREQIVSSRPSELTTLEAIDLTNGATLANVLQAGAKKLFKQDWESPQALTSHLFESALSRSPTEEESAVILSSFAEPMTIEQIEDLLWVLVMMPEFMLIH